MKESKNIERLFQEKFKDFEVNPSLKIWDNIASKLEEKEEKTSIFPFWFNMKAAGIAATFIIGFFAANNYTPIFNFKQELNSTNEQVSLTNKINDNKLNNNVVLSNSNIRPNTFETDKKPDNKLIFDKENSFNNNNIGYQLISNTVLNDFTNLDYITKENGSNLTSKYYTKEENKNSNKYFKDKNRVALENLNTNSNTKNGTKENNLTARSKFLTNTKSKKISSHLENKNTVVVENSNNNQNVKENKTNTHQEYNLKVKNKEIAENVNANTPNNKTNRGTTRKLNLYLKQSNQSDPNEILTASITNSFPKNYKNIAGKTILATTERDLENIDTNRKGLISTSYKNPSKTNNFTIATHQISILDKSKNTNFDFIVDENQILNKSKNKFNQKNIFSTTKNMSASLDIDTYNKNNLSNLNSNSKPVKIDLENIPSVLMIKKDSISIIALVENPLDKIAKEKGKANLEEKKSVANILRWKIKPNVAPLITNGSKGSPIDNEFADNEKKYENTLSLGLGVDYAISKRFSIRTGINKFDYTYNSKNIVYYASMTSKTETFITKFKTIDVASDAKNIIIENKKTEFSPELATQSKDDGMLNQKTGYLEVPLEISYKLLDRKFGIQFITGFSSLFLNENNVSVVSSGLTTVIGQANNLNKIHFSTNIGLGFKYSFWKSFEANFEPTFKYQINTYNSNSGGFKPYIIGLYTGLSFKF